MPDFVATEVALYATYMAKTKSRAGELIGYSVIAAAVAIGLGTVNPDETAPSTIAAGFLLIGALAALVVGLTLLVMRWIKRLVRHNQPSTAPLPAPKHRLATFTVLIIFLGLYVVAGLAWGPISDNYTLSHADPSMVKLADEAGMSRKGKLEFLRTHPKLVSDSEMQVACADNTAANNSNGFIEQGCYSPSSHRIYIRNMPSNLHGLVVSTASYEMLHPVYITLHSSSKGKALDAAIEAGYKSINDARLHEQVANFAKTEPDARDLELFSLLGTGYSNLPGTLTAFYAPYFDDIGKTVASNKQVTQLFDDSQKQLAQAKSHISQYQDLAAQAYASSVSWARAGSQYWDDYYYNLYRSYIEQENTAIREYNQLIKSYNALVTEYNGSQPVKQLNPVRLE